MPNPRASPNSQFPIPNSQFPIPNSPFPIPHSQFPDKCFDIGNTVRQALLNFKATRKPECGSTDAHTVREMNTGRCYRI
ncbi:hypothetical protein [Microcoleus sp.]|uniref:hypothetical protein n=1 Tax=Microcoleus sp. TaxID=44472 RepID=UPI003523D45F